MELDFAITIWDEDMLKLNTEKKFIICSLLFMLYFTKFFNYKYWNSTYAGWGSYVIFLVVVYFFVKCRKNVPKNIPLKKEIILLLVIPFLQIISKVFLFGESFLDERPLILFMTFLFFFILWRYRISEKSIVRAMTIFSLIALGIQLLQQVFHSYAVFGVYNEAYMTWTPTDVAEQRNGIYRFRISGYFVVLLCMYYYWSYFLQKVGFKRFIPFMLMFVSMYLYLTRQILLASFATIMLSFLFLKGGKGKFRTIFFLGLFVAFLSLNFEAIFGQLVESSVQESTMENVRIMCMSFYWQRIVENPLLFLIGHGPLNIIEHWQTTYRFYLLDIGFFGEWFLYGFFWILLYFRVIYMILVRYRKEVPMYLKLFVLGTAINSMMIFPYRSPYEYFVWTCVIYLASVHIYNKKGYNQCGI